MKSATAGSRTDREDAGEEIAGRIPRRGAAREIVRGEAASGEEPVEDAVAVGEVGPVDAVGAVTRGVGDHPKAENLTRVGRRSTVDVEHRVAVGVDGVVLEDDVARLVADQHEPAVAAERGRQPGEEVLADHDVDGLP